MLLVIIPLLDKKSQYFMKNLRKYCKLFKVDALFYQFSRGNIRLPPGNYGETARSWERAEVFNLQDW